MIQIDKLINQTFIEIFMKVILDKKTAYISYLTANINLTKYFGISKN